MENNELPKIIVTKEDFIKFQKQMYIKTKLTMLPKLYDALNAKNWDKFITITLACYEVMPEAFKHYEEVPDNLKYNFAIDAYTNHGDSIPAVRKAVRGARKYGAPTLPPELQGREVITVYRAGEEPPTQCARRISWTTNYDTALFFLDTYNGRHANYLYKAEIKTADIIAYNDDRNEAEVMQYNKVFNIEVLQIKEGA